MNARTKWAIVAVVSLLVLGGTTAFGLTSWAGQQAAQQAASAAEVQGAGSWAGDRRIVFRNTAAGQGYGHVASVALTDPDGPRTVGDAVCDRLDATATQLVCLRIVRGIAPTYSATLYAADGEAADTWPLSGIPSRTRFSPDGALVATTAFVTGHAYATVGFSTETVIHRIDGKDLPTLEEWTLLIDGAPAAPTDRNFWGITFVDDTTFYATVGMTLSGRTYLVRGDIAARTLTTVAENVECPSLSPDGTRVAFKRLTAGSGATAHWTPAVYDIATGEVELLPEARSIDDQIEWLDENTLLYGMPRTDAAGDMDVWAIAADGSRAPVVLIEHAWSPAVVRR